MVPVNVTLPVDGSCQSQIVETPDGIELILVRHQEHEWVSYLNDCPDETRRLNRDGNNRVPLNSAGQLICEHHAARFSACNGCLIATGTAHHVDRLAAGLEQVPVVVNGDTATFTISSALREKWLRITSIRYRKSFGRGPLGLAKYLLATFQ